MKFRANRTYYKNELTTWSAPNPWDILAASLIFILIAFLAIGAKQMAAPYRLGDLIPIHLAPSYLPIYAIRTTIRMFIALLVSLIFTFVVGSWAAKNRHAERIIIPLIDVLQSVPVLSFLSITISCFIFLFKNSMLGPECAAIFGVFTSQVWNITLSFYQSLKTLPKEMKEAASIFHLSAWQKFWRIEVPFSMPGLLWNMMMSMSGSWFFVIACEAFTTSGADITLPGVGSYIWLAIMQADSQAIIYAICCMLLVIFLYDQLLFRPLIYWIERFREHDDEEERIPRSWLVSLFQRTKFLRCAVAWLDQLTDKLITLPAFNQRSVAKSRRSIPNFWVRTGYILSGIMVILVLVGVWCFLFRQLPLNEFKQVIILGLFTGARVLSFMLISSLIWVPVGVWIGLRPRISAIVQPIIQFAAAFPANLLFPVATMLIMSFKLNVEIWTAPLMVLGTQWYILFNVISGTSQIPKELKLAADNFKLKGWLRWKRFILPSIAPSYITGAITAAGGAWNASIIAEVITWGDTKLRATGIGSYIQYYFEQGDTLRVALGTVVMCIMVLLINRLIWRPLYKLAISRVVS